MVPDGHVGTLPVATLAVRLPGYWFSMPDESWDLLMDAWECWIAALDDADADADDVLMRLLQEQGFVILGEVLLSCDACGVKPGTCCTSTIFTYSRP